MASRAAFSLVELSIVLVILGLLTGGILTGQNLIRAAELRSVTTEFSQYQTAVMTFRDKYFAIPGDMTNATDFWGVQSACSGSATDGVCNGNGNGILGNNNASTANSADEELQFWRHLASAGLVEGNYTGLAGTANPPSSTGQINAVAGENSPKSKLSPATWHPINFIYLSYAGLYWDIPSGVENYLLFGGAGDARNAHDAVLTPEEAWNIDKKIDDGKPARGKVMALHWDGTCSEADDGSNANNDFNASYRLSDSSVQCSFLFRDAF